MSLKVAGTDEERLTIYDFLLVFHTNAVNVDRGNDCIHRQTFYTYDHHSIFRAITKFPFSLERAKHIKICHSHVQW